MDKKENNKKKSDEILTDDNRCDLDPNKICDNCCKCIMPENNYKIIKITKIVDKEEDI